MDTKPDLLKEKDLIDSSMKTIETGHPATFMLWPNNKPAATPGITAEEKGHWVVRYRQTIAGGGMKTPLGFGLTLVGHAE